MMVSRRGMNNKGQLEREQFGGLIIVALVVIIVAIAIYFISSSASTTVARLAPEEMSALRARCIASSNIGGGLGNPDFCSFKEQTFGGKAGVANCQEKTVFDALMKDANYATQVQAASDSCRDSANVKAKSYCNELADKNQFKNLLVNGFSCSSYGATGRACKDILNPENTPSGWEDSATCIGDTIKGTIVRNQVVDQKDIDSNKGKVCCMYPVGHNTANTPAAGSKTEGQKCSKDSNDCTSTLQCLPEIIDGSPTGEYTCQ